MTTARCHVARMDCAAEEQLVRLALSEVAGIESVHFDLDARTVAVVHEIDPDVVLTALEPLDLDTTPLEHDAGSPAAAVSARTGERQALAIALVINAVFFVAELAAGLLANSMGLVADSLDMLADASVYTLSLLAVGGPAMRKRRLAAGSGYLQLTLAVAGLVEVTRRVLADEPLPDVTTMVVVAVLALAANVATLLVLQLSLIHI